MIDSGASELVANADKFSEYPLVKTTGSGTEYSSAAESGGAVTNVRRKIIEVVDVSGCMSAGYRLLFYTPDCGSYMECKTTGLRRWLRQEHGVFFLDLWVKTLHFGWQVQFRSVESTYKIT